MILTPVYMKGTENTLMCFPAQCLGFISVLLYSEFTSIVTRDFNTVVLYSIFQVGNLSRYCTDLARNVRRMDGSISSGCRRFKDHMECNYTICVHLLAPHDYYGSVLQMHRKTTHHINRITYR